MLGLQSYSQFLDEEWFQHTLILDKYVEFCCKLYVITEKYVSKMLFL